MPKPHRGMGGVIRAKRETPLLLLFLVSSPKSLPARAYEPLLFGYGIRELADEAAGPMGGQTPVHPNQLLFCLDSLFLRPCLINAAVSTKQLASQKVEFWASELMPGNLV
jgi:hypothetical protein